MPLTYMHVERCAVHMFHRKPQALLSLLIVLCVITEGRDRHDVPPPHHMVAEQPHQAPLTAEEAEWEWQRQLAQQDGALEEDEWYNACSIPTSPVHTEYPCIQHALNTHVL